MSYTVADIAKFVNAKVYGEGDCVIDAIASLASAGSGQLAYLRDASAKDQLATTQASVVLLQEAYVDACPTNAIVCENSQLAFAKVAGLFAKKPYHQSGIHPSAVIEDDCEIDPTVSIGAYCVIGEGTKIGKNTMVGPGVSIGHRSVVGESCLLHARCTLYHNVKLGDRVIIHSGAVIGADGFGLANDKGKWQKIPQLGSVLLADDVEIGANTCVDRGAMGDTVIKTGAKLDNQIQVGHNVIIGAHTAIAGCTGIAGSTTIGNHCLVGGAVSINGHITIADHVTIAACSAVMASISEPGIYSATPILQPYRDWAKTSVRIKQLDKMNRRLYKLEKICHD